MLILALNSLGKCTATHGIFPSKVVALICHDLRLAMMICETISLSTWMIYLTASRPMYSLQVNGKQLPADEQPIIPMSEGYEEGHGPWIHPKLGSMPSILTRAISKRGIRTQMDYIYCDVQTVLANHELAHSK